MRTTFTMLLLLSGTTFADGMLTPEMRITSDILGYDVQYRVYLPENYESSEALPVLYVTDGQGYIRHGKVPQVLDRLIATGRMEPVITVFVDPQDPDDPGTNRRNEQFFCNPEYLRFYTEEFIPAIELSYPVGTTREKRSILGVSFGGLNAACFGLLGYDTFSAIGMHSPANHPVPKLLSAYEEMPTLPLRIFLSTGEPDDNTRANRKFRNVLRGKGYDLKYVEVHKGHNWDNWRSLIDDVLLYFYAPGNQLNKARQAPSQ